MPVGPRRYPFDCISIPSPWLRDQAVILNCHEERRNTRSWTDYGDRDKHYRPGGAISRSVKRRFIHPFSIPDNATIERPALFAKTPKREFYPLGRQLSC